MGAEWANQILQLVSTNTSTENDFYGKYLTKLQKEMGIFHDDIILDFLNCMKVYVEQITKQLLVINWEEEIKLAIEKKKELEKSTTNKKKRYRANGRPTYTEDYDFV